MEKISSIETAEHCAIEWPADLVRGSHFKCGLVMPIWNRPAVTKRTLDSIRCSDHGDMVLVLVDDASESRHTREIIRDFNPPGLVVIKVRVVRPCVSRPSMYYALRMGWDVLFHYLDCEYLGTLDSDVEVKEDWMERIYEVERVGSERYGRCIVGGFRSHAKGVLSCHEGYWRTQYFAGINATFKRDMYPELIRPCLVGVLWDFDVQRALLQGNVPILLTRPSVIQHTGHYGTWSSGLLEHDISLDYHFPYIATKELYYQLARPVRISLRIMLKVLVILNERFLQRWLLPMRLRRMRRAH